ncbi:hypothetical protein HY357_04330, partial [Candidatus Roizmanbacteria bacterium]|nr:hypothetical protein [Candidatus Roizmanbacteria bacterium]
TLAFFRRDYEKKETIKFKSKVASHYLTPETRKVVITGLILITLLFFSYFGFQLKIYFSPPRIDIISPKTNTFKKDTKVKIIGKTEKDAAVTIFGERVFQNKEGVFQFDFPLQKGKNELLIEVVGANGKKSTFKTTYIRTD